MLEKAQTTGLETTSGIHESIALSLSQASTLKSRQRLSSKEMSDLIDRLFACANHNFTPDGKKIMTVWSQDDIDSAFR